MKEIMSDTLRSSWHAFIYHNS